MHSGHQSYSLLLIELSYVVAVLGSFTALQLAMMIPLAQSRLARWSAIMAAGTAMGAGAIWAMHFIGMLAVDTGMPVAYGIGMTILSALVAVIACSIGLALAGTGRFNWPRAAQGGLYMGLGVAGMHYLGMLAMQMPATVSYRPGMVVLSIVIAVAASMAALWMAFNLRGALQLVGSALVMGLAVCGMHYTGMAAAHFTPLPMVSADMSQSLPASELGMVVFVVVSALLLLTLLLHRLRKYLLQKAFLGGFTRLYQRRHLASALPADPAER